MLWTYKELTHHSSSKPFNGYAFILIILIAVSTTANANFSGLPVIASSPETGLQYGALLIQNLNEEAVDGKLSTIQYIAINSTENQRRFVVRPTFYFLDYKLKLTPNINYSSFPEKFYGISNASDKNFEEDFTSEYLLLRFDMQYNVYSDFHLKFLSSSDDRAITKYEKGGAIDTMLGGSLLEYRLTSTGMGLVWDTRDSPRYPSSGYYAEISQENYGGEIYDYDEQRIDLRAFVSMGNKKVLATQAIQVDQDGVIPFINLATIGGSDVVRGFYEGRYRGTQMQALQVEYRQHGYEWSGLDTGWTVFIASGRVDASDVIADDSDDFHSAVGIGGHFFFNPEDQTTIRADLAYGEDGSAFYLMIDQAF